MLNNLVACFLQVGNYHFQVYSHGQVADSDSAMSLIFGREFPEDRKLNHAPMIFIPDSFVFKELTEKVGHFDEFIRHSLITVETSQVKYETV